MGLNIKDPEAHKLAQQLATETVGFVVDGIGV